jgi:LCP family protein required for cell wall assembly
MAKIHRSPADSAAGKSRTRGRTIRRAYDYDQEMRTNPGYHPAKRQPRAPSGESRRVSAAAARKQRERRRKSRRVVLVQAALSALLVWQVWRTQMLPMEMMIALVVALILLWSFTVAMQKYPRRGAFTRFCAWVLSAAMAVGCIFTEQGLMALQTITTGGGQIVVGVYVLKEDPAKKIQDTTDYPFGCIAEMDRENTDKTFTDISAKTGAAPQAAEYANMFDLVNGLYNGEVRAIVLNQSFVAMLEDEESGYTDFSSRTRCIYTCRLENASLMGTVTGAEAKKITQEPFLVYLSGVDTRGELKEACRSDVNIIAAVNPTTKRVVLINTPRDYYVELADAGGAMDKLTHAGLYGADRSIKTLDILYGVDIRYYVKINFAGFVGIIDALGGIDVVSDQAFTSVGSPGYYNPTSFAEGQNHLDGAAALAFARERHAFKNGDIQRGINQMKVISAMVDKIQSPAVLRGYSSLMNHVADSFVTNLSHDQVGALVRMQLGDGAQWTVENYSVTGSSAKSTKCYSAQGSNLYVMKPDMDTVAAAQAMIASVMNGEPAPGAQSEAAGSSPAA